MKETATTVRAKLANDPKKLARFNIFMKMFRGIPTHQVVPALHTFHFGINWHGCPKSHLAWCYATADDYNHPWMITLDLSLLRSRAMLRWEGDDRWRTVK